jgi:glycolate oxidase
VQAELESVLKVLSGASSLKVSESEKERLNLWKGRKSAFPAVGRLSPDYYCMDGTIPRRHLADMLEKIHLQSPQLLQWQNCPSSLTPQE